MRTSKRDYIAIIDIIQRLEKRETKRLAWAHAFAHLLKLSNPAFDKKVFINAARQLSSKLRA